MPFLFFYSTQCNQKLPLPLARWGIGLVTAYWDCLDFVQDRRRHTKLELVDGVIRQKIIFEDSDGNVDFEEDDCVIFASGQRSRGCQNDKYKHFVSTSVLYLTLHVCTCFLHFNGAFNCLSFPSTPSSSWRLVLGKQLTFLHVLSFTFDPLPLASTLHLLPGGCGGKPFQIDVVSTNQLSFELYLASRASLLTFIIFLRLPQQTLISSDYFFQMLTVN